VSAYLFPLGATTLVAAVTYVTCVRPMLKGRGCPTAVTGRGTDAQRCGSTATPTSVEQIRALNEEVQLLRHELELRDAAGAPATSTMANP
jgi:hypothetical protein